MTEFEATSTLDMQPSNNTKISHYSHHNLHTEGSRKKNPEIVPTDTPLNSTVKINDIDSLLHDQYGDVIAESNQKILDQFNNGKLSQKRLKDRTKTIDTYKNKNAFTSVVMTIGEVSILPELMDSMGIPYEKTYKPDDTDKTSPRYTVVGTENRKKWANFWRDVYTDAAKRIDRKGLRPSDMAVHVDEAGMPHSHMVMVNGGLTAKGKPSASLNSAIKQVLGDKATKDTRANMREYRKFTDSNMIASFNEQAKKYGFNVDLKMIRTREKGGLDMPAYKAQKRQMAKQNQSLSFRENAVADAFNATQSMQNSLSISQQHLELQQRLFSESLADFEKSMASAESSFNISVADAKASIADASTSFADSKSAVDSSLASTIDSLAVESQAQDSAISSRADDWDSKESDLIAKSDELVNDQEDFKALKTKRLNQLQIRENNLNDRENAMNERDSKMKKSLAPLGDKMGFNTEKMSIDEVLNKFFKFLNRIKLNLLNGIKPTNRPYHDNYARAVPDMDRLSHFKAHYGLGFPNTSEQPKIAKKAQNTPKSVSHTKLDKNGNIDFSDIASGHDLDL